MGSEEIIIAGVVIGGLLTLVGGVVLAFFTKYHEDNRNKRFTAGALLAEVTENQKLLKLLTEKNSAPSVNHFSITLYYALLDKAALLHPNTIKHMVKYYAKLEIMNDKMENNRQDIDYDGTYEIGIDLIEELNKEVEKGLFYLQKAKIKNFFS
jgi:hypothetical protein